MWVHICQRHQIFRSSALATEDRFPKQKKVVPVSMEAPKRAIFSKAFHSQVAPDMHVNTSRIVSILPQQCVRKCMLAGIYKGLFVWNSRQERAFLKVTQG